MKTIYFIINQRNNHETIIKKGSGASEVLFYLTAKSLSKNYNLIIYNKDSPCTLDDIEYRYLSDNMMARDSDFQKVKHILEVAQNNEKLALVN